MKIEDEEQLIHCRSQDQKSFFLAVVAGVIGSVLALGGAVLLSRSYAVRHGVTLGIAINSLLVSAIVVVLLLTNSIQRGPTGIVVVSLVFGCAVAPLCALVGVRGLARACCFRLANWDVVAASIVGTVQFIAACVALGVMIVEGLKFSM